MDPGFVANEHVYEAARFLYSAHFKGSITSFKTVIIFCQMSPPQVTPSHLWNRGGNKAITPSRRGVHSLMVSTSKARARGKGKNDRAKQEMSLNSSA